MNKFKRSFITCSSIAQLYGTFRKASFQSKVQLEPALGLSRTLFGARRISLWGKRRGSCGCQHPFDFSGKFGRKEIAFCLKMQLFPCLGRSLFLLALLCFGLGVFRQRKGLLLMVWCAFFSLFPVVFWVVSSSFLAQVCSAPVYSLYMLGQPGFPFFWWLIYLLFIHKKKRTISTHCCFDLLFRNNKTKTTSCWSEKDENNVVLISAYGKQN